jgi:O-antigen ligase
VNKYFSSLLSYFRTFHPAFHQLLNASFLIYAILLPFSDAFTSHTGPWILLFFWLLEGEIHRKIRRIFNEKALLFWLLFLSFSSLSLLWTTNIHDGIHILRYYFTIAIISITLYTSLDRKFAPWLLYSFLGAMFISEIVSYGIYLDLWHTRRATPQNPTPFMHHVIYSIFLAVTVILLLGQILNQKNRIWVRALELIFLLSVTQRAIFYGILAIFIVSFFIDVPLRNYSSGLFAFLIGYFLSHLSDSKSLKSKSNINIQI